MGTCSANFSLQQGVLALPWPCDVALREDALTLLRSLPDGCTALVFFDPQYRDVLDKLKFRQRRGAAEGSLHAAADDRRLYRRLRPRGSTYPAAIRLPAAVERHVQPLPRPPSAHCRRHPSASI